MILWNAVKVEFENKERLPSVHRIIEPHRDVIVLNRKNDVTTKIDNTLSSAHCPNCGGSLSSSFDVKCQYCGTILNDGSEWILEKLTNENDLEYKELTQKGETMLTFAIEQKKIKEKKIKQDLEKELQISTARDLVAASAQIMLANGYIADSEQETYDNLCKNCCISKEEGQKILNDIKDGRLKVEFSKDKKGKAAKMILDVAIEMAYADGVLHPNQRKFILEFARQMGFVNIDIDFLIKKYESKLAIQKIRDEKESVRLKAREKLNEHYKRAQEKNKQ